MGGNRWFPAAFKNSVYAFRQERLDCRIFVKCNLPQLR